MILFAENPSMYMGGFSHEFETEFVKLLKRRFEENFFFLCLISFF